MIYNLNYTCRIIYVNKKISWAKRFAYIFTSKTTSLLILLPLLTCISTISFHIQSVIAILVANREKTKKIKAFQQKRKNRKAVYSKI